MPNSKPYYVTFRYQEAQDGTVTVTAIREGTHIGGVAESKYSFAGGLDVPTAQAFHHWAGHVVSEILFGVSQGALGF